MSKAKRLVSLLLVAIMLAGTSFAYLDPSTEISGLPEAIFDVYGTEMDRGFLAAKVSNGVFLSWRYFPEEADGVSDSGEIGADGGLVGADFVIFRNGTLIAHVTDSTDYLDEAGTVDDEYTVVTVVDGAYVSKSKTLKPFAASGSSSAGYYLDLQLQRPASGYSLDESSVGDVDGDGQMEIVVKWLTANPDVIQSGEALVVYDCYKIKPDMSGVEIMWRLDMGKNIRGGQHYLMPMLYDYDGDGKAEFMVQTAPGTRYATAADGVLGEYTYISMPETVHTDWNGNKNWSHTDNYQSTDGSMTSDTRQNGSIFQWMVQFFKNWQDHPDVREARYGANLELLKDSKEQGGYGWWQYPPQVMMGMYPAGYEKLDGTVVSAAGRHNAYTEQSTVTGWTQAQWDILNAIPKDPAEFKNYTITDEDALALAYLWFVNNEIDGGTRDRWKQSGHIIDGPEYFSVFNGETGAELDTIPYAVTRGIVDPVTGKYYPDIGIMWNDFTGSWDETMNRIERHNGAVAYLDGAGENPSCVQQRGYYSRTTVTRYDWDGEHLTSNVLVDSGFEVSPNPFANGTGVVGGAIAYGNTHAGPGRREVCFNPESPLKEKPEYIATVELANKYGSITCQGFHSMSVMDVDGDGFDELIMGNLCLNHDGSVRWTGYEQRYGTGSNLTQKTGAIEKLGHGDSLHVGYFDPDQEVPKMWGCLEGAWWDTVLRDANTGEVLYTDGPASSTTAWGSQRDNGRAMVGKYTGETGWQLYGNQSFHSTPFGSSGDDRQGGNRQADGVHASAATSNPSTTASIFFRPNLLTQFLSGESNLTVRSNDGTGGSFIAYITTSGTTCQGGTKGQPNLVADFFGDFREELFLTAGTSLRVYFNVEDSTHKLASLMTDRRYRCEVERQKSCYNQPSYTGYYYGADMDLDVYFESIQDPYRAFDPLARPAMPENVEYAPVTEDSVTITWDPVDGADGYNIYRRDSKTAKAEKLAAIASAGYYDDAVVPGADYWYSVSAYNAGGESAKTKEAFIMLANDDAVLLNRFQVKVKGSRLRLGDLDGDGRTDILVCHTTSQSNYTTNGSVLYVLIAYNLEGEILWEFSIDPNYDPNDPNSGVTGSSADEPVNIADVNGDGFNDVVALMHKDKNRAANYTGGEIVILDGRTGKLLKDSEGNECRKPVSELSVPGLTSTTINTLGDCFAFGNFDGRATDNQFIVLKARYSNVTVLEMFDKDGKFAMNYVYRHASAATGANQTRAGHMPLVTDLDGDGVDELLSNYTVFKVKMDEDGNVLRHAADVTTGNAGQPVMEFWWWIKSNVEIRSGAEGMPGAELNDSSPAYYTGTETRIQTSDHCDTIQVGYVLGEDGPLCVLFGGAGPDGAGTGSYYRSSTFCYTWDGVFQWVSNSALEPQSLNLAQFRTDHDGLTTYGLDRRNRGSYPSGRDSMFLIGSQGEPLFLEYPVESGNPMGWSTIVIRVDNWTGTYAPLCLSFNRNGESRAAARAGNYPTSGTGTEASKAAWTADYREPALYDGYTNTLINMDVPQEDREYMFDNNVDWRYMAMDLCGDARTELVGYDDAGNILIYYNNSNGDIRIDGDGTLNEEDSLAVLRSGITGEPKQQTYFMSNYTRYPTDVYFSNIENRTPAQPVARDVTGTSAYIDWTPIITATSYTLYRNGEKLGDFTGVGYQDNGIVPGVEYRYTVTASDGKGVSPESLPLALNTGEKAALLSIAVDTRIVNLVNGYAANIPVTVTANNPNGLEIYAGLYVDGALAASAKTVNGAATIKAGAFSTDSANVYVRAWFEGEEPAISKAIPVKHLPADMWAPEVDVSSPEGETVVFFAEKLSLSATAAMSINGVSVKGFAADGPKLTISAGSVEGDVIVMKGIKYPELFPSYSFTFTAVRGPALEERFETMYFQFGQRDTTWVDGYTKVSVPGSGNSSSGSGGAPDLPYTEAQGWGIVERSAVLQGRTRGGEGVFNTWLGGNGTPWEFKVNLPNGTYKVTVYGTDVSGTNNITVDVNGVSSGYVTRASTNLDPVMSADVVVTDGLMHFTFTGNASNGNQGYVNAIIIEAAE